MVVLWTDALIYLLVFIILVLAFYLKDKDHIKRPMAMITRSKIGMVSLVVLVFFVIIGLLDSIHFKPAGSKSGEIISVFDAIATELREHNEKTYSAPFATTLFSKEILVEPDGSTLWTYPRLQFGGSHLTDPDSQKNADIVEKSLIGLVFGVGVCTFILLMYWLWFFRKQKGRESPETLVAIASTTFIIIILVSIFGYLSRYYHVMGTDKVGEDVFYQALKSIRTGLVIGTLTTLVMLPFAILFGIVAGYFGGWIDDIIQYLYTTLNSIPSVLLIAASILMVQVYMANHEADFTSAIIRADTRLLFLCMILGLTSWTGLCRLLRAETLKLRELEYVQAAKALGVKNSRILLRHILPNVMHIVLISVVLDFSSLVLAEAVLSYINIGVDPSTFSWGNMINSARLELARDPIVWWSLTAAFVFMFALVLAANLFSDTVQQAFDPRRSGNR
jgi:peptide/nickel transport system permease protein